MFNLLLQFTNRRNLKENLTISNKQRFSIRKFSIGVASVMLGTTLYFMGGVGTSIVHADSVQGQSVQTSNLDTNSAQASSDTSSAEQTSSQNQTSSAQNSQKAVSNASSNTESTDSKTQTSDQVDNATTDKNEASQADNASATNIKTRDNKKVVSDANRAKSTANDAQTKPAQQTAKSDAANSNTLVVQRTKKLTVNAKLLADSKAQTDTKTDSKYSVTDNYPKDLMNYLPSDFENTQEYAFEWLQNENNNNIILTTNRTGDGVVYVYQDGEKVGTLAKKSSCSLQDTIVDNWGYDHTIKIGTVYNDDYAGIVQSNNGYLLNIIYSSHAKDVDNAGSSYSTVSFFVPHKIKQTVTYKNSKGNVIDRLTHTQYGLTGQSYTTGLPSGSDYVRAHDHEYLDNITNNSSGLISEFYNGYSCTKDYHDGVKVTFTENDSDGIGAMDYVVKDNGKEVKSGILKYGKSAEYDKYAWNGWYWYKSHSYTIVNPYVPQTTKIVYQYKKLGNVVNIVPGPEGKTTTTTTPYTNDPDDPTTIEPINVPPSIPGYTTMVNGKTVSDKTKPFKPADLSKNTYITYTPDQQKAKVLFIDDTAKTTLATHNLTGVTNGHESYNPSEEIEKFTKEHYVLVPSDYPANGFTYDNDDSKDQVFEIHLKHGTHAISDKKSITETITYKMSDGSTAPDKVEKQVEFSRVGKHDDVTNTDTWDEWQSDKQSFDVVPTPEVKGYTPDAKSVEAKTVTAGDKDITVTVTYTPDQQKAKVLFIDDTAKTTLATHNLTGVTNGHESYSPSKEINQFVDKHYVLVSSDYPEKGFTYDNDDSKDQVFEVHLVHTYEPVETSQTITETVHFIDANGKPVAPDHVAKVVIKVTGTRDKVTDSIIWNTPSTGHFDEVISPEVPNMTPDKKLIPGRDVQYGDSDITESVVYTPDNSTSKTPEKPDKPSKEVSKTPEKPNKPSKEVSKIPEKPNKSSKEVSKAPEKSIDSQKSIDSRTVDNHVSAKSTAKRELPQTGATTNTGIWTGLVSMIASLGLLGASKKRKKN